jgi:hypothetical protein
MCRDRQFSVAISDHLAWAVLRRGWAPTTVSFPSVVGCPDGSLGNNTSVMVLTEVSRSFVRSRAPRDGAGRVVQVVATDSRAGQFP